jgi:ankyrin repeat protein
MLFWKERRQLSPDSVRCGYLALYLAAHGGSAAVVELLLGAGAAADVRGSDGWTALMVAARGGFLGIVGLLPKENRRPFDGGAFFGARE